MGKIKLQLLYIAAIIALLGCFFLFDLHNTLRLENITKVKEWFLQLGFWAPLLMIPIYIVLNIIAVPRVFFTIFSGYLFGVVYGFLWAWLATMTGLAVTFLLIRYLFHESFEKKFGNRKLVENLNILINKHGIWLVIFLRAIYIFPSSVLNYSFGFTKIKTSRYLLGSAIGFIPVVLVNVMAGDALARQLENEMATYILIALVVVISVLVLTGNWVRKKIMM